VILPRILSLGRLVIPSLNTVHFGW
jgi:hypothetical protein